jgi:hypothetical protein
VVDVPTLSPLSPSPDLGGLEGAGRETMTLARALGRFVRLHQGHLEIDFSRALATPLADKLACRISHSLAASASRDLQVHCRYSTVRNDLLGRERVRSA